MTGAMPTVTRAALRTAATADALGRGAPEWPDTLAARAEALARMQRLNALLLGARSATAALDQWCVGHRPGPRIRARVARDMRKEPTAAQRERLRAGPGETVLYRRVQLAFGDRVLSDADNWYVPSRLTSEMNRLLETTDIPFGRAVRDLEPLRETLETVMHWQPPPDGGADGLSPPDRPGALTIPPTLFEYRALLLTGDGMPLSEVYEVYRGDLLAFGPPK